MHYLTTGKDEVELTLLPVSERSTTRGLAFTVGGSEDSGRLSTLVTGAARAVFEWDRPRAARARRRGVALPAVFRETRSGRLRVVYHEVVLRVEQGTSSRTLAKILTKYGLAVRRRNRFVRRQYVVHDPTRKQVGPDLVAVANGLAMLDEIKFAIPNFVSEYAREAIPAINKEQWHLDNKARHRGQKKGEDVDAIKSWKLTLGSSMIAVAVLDDGVDVEHPNLRNRIIEDPDPDDERDTVGRDFFVPDDHPEHFNPRPKIFQFPFDEMLGNDIHGTPCAGVIAASGTLNDVRGIAPRCRILPVKIFHADNLASDARVADAIRYAARFADILSCSWSGPYSPDVELAIQDAGETWGGLGSAVFCAAGNGGGDPVEYPAALADAIAVGASTDKGRRASYSNVGKELDFVAPSSGGVRGIFTTDVGYESRGFNVGVEAAGGADGEHTNDFGGTSSATPLAAGIGGLMLSVNPDLHRDTVRQLMRETADKIGSGYSAGHSPRFGYGRVNAAAAVAAAREAS